MNGDQRAVNHHEICGVHFHVDVGDHTVAEVKVHIGQLAVGPDVIGQLTVGQLDLGQLAVRQLDLGQLAVRQLDLGLLTVGQLHAGPLAQRRGVVSTLGERGDAQQDTNDQRDRQPPVDLLHNTFSLRFSHALHRTAWRLFHPTQNVTCISILYQLQGKSNPFSKFVFLFVFAFRGHGACQHAGGELPLPPALAVPWFYRVRSRSSRTFSTRAVLKWKKGRSGTWKISTGRS